LSFRPKLFLTFAALCTGPLLIISLINLRSGVSNAEALLRSVLADELNDVERHFQTLVRARESELRAAANGPLANFVRTARTPEAVALIDPRQGSAVSGAAADAAYAARRAIGKLPLTGYYAELACFDSARRLIFLFQPAPGAQATFRTSDVAPGIIEPDPTVWSATSDATLCSPVSHPVFGEVLRCTAPIFLEAQEDAASARGALVADLRLADLFSNLDAGGSITTENPEPARRFMVWNSSGKIVYHQNEAFKNQPVANVMSGLGPTAKTAGREEFRSADGERWIAASRTVSPFGLSMAVTRNYSQASAAARQAGWLEIALSILFGLGTATVLTSYFQKKTHRLEQISESVAAIVGGNLEGRVEARSSDDLRPLADNLNVMKERLREQLAREAEARQFESFVKLSALLTHDLKNAIEGLSLMVGNMERHFDNPKFRADAMKGLTSAADKLRGLVTRLTNPINTLSGEFKLPRPTDLVPLLRRVLAQIGDPLEDKHEIESRLPSSLIALADSERLEKVMENLVLNAVEAMTEKPGKLTVAAGTLSDGKVFFSVSDTGYGIRPEFIRQRLFHPFATTKSQGVGLGLYTCREVVRANGGSIEVESKEGSGTTFRVVLASPPQIKQRR
jgi:signal transduction histidine kinase